MLVYRIELAHAYHVPLMTYILLATSCCILKSCEVPERFLSSNSRCTGTVRHKYTGSKWDISWKSATVVWGVYRYTDLFLINIAIQLRRSVVPLRECAMAIQRTGNL